MLETHIFCLLSSGFRSIFFFFLDHKHYEVWLIPSGKDGKFADLLKVCIRASTVDPKALTHLLILQWDGHEPSQTYRECVRVRKAGGVDNEIGPRCPGSEAKKMDESLITYVPGSSMYPTKVPLSKILNPCRLWVPFSWPLCALVPLKSEKKIALWASIKYQTITYVAHALISRVT